MQNAHCTHKGDFWLDSFAKCSHKLTSGGSVTKQIP